MIKIISMKEEHIPQIYEIEKSCFTIPWSKDAFEKELKENPLAYYIVAESKGNILGYAGMWKIADEGHITNIAVHPDFQHQGVGTLLMQGIIEEAQRNHFIGLTLEVRESNIKAQNLYKKFGFVNEGIRKGYYQDTGENAVIMWKYFKE
ncbi:ribosomal protein S18-alanine N-acetyltransferase [Defluviitalea raffinosedens]|jgi:ribosomal-protein-alanine N-acetyltransferase|uniref:[Ribosomal protein bS18]-alanine N-acetyltransferase n=1 Tax=Defluviitalea raffinosedens TaxID=1450156 RepID=A0A7C8LG00_9FIRM|nr:ribosomal protein S18-alanine N-acetyltransferase [Defluviitalea raffinosedens]KAE9632005.1 ribosomal protein S18-alanine N-acetyltransferase [Defluviitalea raffinosedens]MBM7686494.1 ribosomal-protein-alanine N-acetyltransferase [Defluviitalea raffinosedens]MBZ4667373.1 putative acetyltransferase [Defluviitaleaceae bacterium]HHW66409.1 ribosomal protein S18-alanine N-acetyltransferase [Candidatus Epulonipiscium sp.]